MSNPIIFRNLLLKMMLYLHLLSKIRALILSIQQFLLNFGNLRLVRHTNSCVLIDSAMVLIFLPHFVGTGFASSGTALVFIKVSIDPRSNCTFSNFLDFTTPIVSTTMIEIGVRLLFFGSLFLGTGISYRISPASSSTVFSSNTL